MMISIKYYFYTALFAVVGVLGIVFRLRGLKIDNLEAKVATLKQERERAAFEARNKAKAEEVQDVEVTNTPDGAHRL